MGLVLSTGLGARCFAAGAASRAFCCLAADTTALVPSVHVEPLLVLIGAASTKDFADMEGDRAGGRKTLPIVYGVKKAIWIIAPFFVLPWLFVPLGAFLPDPQNPEHPILTGNPWILTSFGAVFTVWGIYTVYLLLRDPNSLTETENHPSWKHMYLMMMGSQVAFALAYLF